MNAVQPSFSTPTDEIAHWKRKWEETELSLQDARLELDEFQEGSRELEAELEAQLEQSEKRIRDLEATRQRLEIENESLRERLEGVQNDAFVNVSSLQEEVATLTLHRDTLQKYVRELEQTNDDLERAQRATVVSLEDFDRQLNSAIERNAILENELDEKESLQEMVQRLKDEARDLRSELAVRAGVTSMKQEQSRGMDELDGSIEEVSSSGLPPTPHSTPQGAATPSVNHTEVTIPLTPTSRMAALNIVGDLLRKVGALESKLASSRHIKKVRDMTRAAKRSSRRDSKDSTQAANGMVKITV